MKNTKKIALIVAALSFGSFAQAIIAPAGMVNIDNTEWDGGPDNGIGGGEFVANSPGGLFDSFITFCLEKTTAIQYNDVNYSLSNNANNGGPGDVISQGTAWLYRKFLAGSLYDRTEDAAHDNYAGLLQAAIWYLEDEVTPAHPSVGPFLVANPFLAAANAEFGGNEKDDYTGSTVRVMNLVSKEGKYLQDQLVYVPDSGATLAMTLLGLAGLVAMRRKFSA